MDIIDVNSLNELSYKQQQKLGGRHVRLIDVVGNRNGLQIRYRDFRAKRRQELVDSARGNGRMDKRPMRGNTQTIRVSDLPLGNIDSSITRLEESLRLFTDFGGWGTYTAARGDLKAFIEEFIANNTTDFQNTGILLIDKESII